MIGIDLSFIRPDHKNGGTESYIKNLMRGFVENHSHNEMVFFAHRDIYTTYRTLFPQLTFYVYDTKGSHKMRTLWFQTFSLPRLIKKMNLKLIFFPTYTTGLKRKFHVPLAVNPQDIQFKYFPEYFSTFKKLYFEYLYKDALRKSSKVIAISEYVKGTLLEQYPKECEGKVQVIHVPILFLEDEKEVPTIAKPYILSVNSLLKHKNLITLLKAYQQIANITEHNLILVGIKGNAVEALETFISDNQLQNRIQLTGFLEDAQLKWLYKNADVFVTTSMYEGFGMTPVEAISAGCRVISTMDTSLEEVTMGIPRYYAPSDSSKALVQCLLEELAKEKDETALKKNSEQVREVYNTKKIAAAYYEMFQEMLVE